jgi:hypothetical protein
MKMSELSSPPITLAVLVQLHAQARVELRLEENKQERRKQTEREEKITPFPNLCRKFFLLAF